MPTTTVTRPDGSTLDITHPEGASEQNILRFAAYQDSLAMAEEDPYPLVEEEEEEEEETSTFGAIGEGLKRVPGEAFSTITRVGTGAAQYFSELLDDDEEERLEDTLLETQRGLDEKKKSFLGYDEDYDDSTITQVLGAVGSTVPFIGAGIVGATVGLPVAATTAVVAGLGALTYGAIGAEDRAETEARTGVKLTDAQENQAKFANAAIGSLEGLGAPFRILRRIPSKVFKGPGGKEIESRFKEAIDSGIAEGSQEAAASLVSDLAAKGIYDPDRDIFTVGKAGDYFEEGIIGGGAGFISDVFLGGIGRRKALSDSEKIQEFEDSKLDAEEVEAGNANAMLAGQAEEPTIDPAQGTMPYIDADPVEIDDSADGTAIRFPFNDPLKARASGIARKMGESFPVDEEFTVVSGASEGERAGRRQRLTKEGDSFLVEKYTQELDTDAVDTATLEKARETYEGDEQKARDAYVSEKVQQEKDSLLDDTQQKYNITSQEYVVVDSKGTRYGPKLNDINDAINLAGSLKESGISEAAQRDAKEMIDLSMKETGIQYDGNQIQNLLSIARRIFSPYQKTYNSEQVDYAADTVAATGYIHQGLTAKQAQEKNIKPKDMTASQKINRDRLKRGLPETNTFTLKEIRKALGQDVGDLYLVESGAGERLTYEAIQYKKTEKSKPRIAIVGKNKYGEIKTEPILDRPLNNEEERQRVAGSGKNIKYNVKTRKKIPFINLSDATKLASEMNQKRGLHFPAMMRGKQPKATEKRFNDLLQSKNIEDNINSPAIRSMVSRFIGRTLRRDQTNTFNNLTESEKKLLFVKLNQLPEFEVPTKLPVFSLKPVEKAKQQRSKETDTLGLPDPVQFESRDDVAVLDKQRQSDIKKEVNKVVETVEAKKVDEIGQATVAAGPLANINRSDYVDNVEEISSFETPSTTVTGRIGKNFIFQVADKLVGLKDIVASINKSRAAKGIDPIKDTEDPYIGEELLAGKMGVAQRQFQEQELQPLIDEMVRLEINPDKFDEFLVLRHALERNKRIRNINKQLDPQAQPGAGFIFDDAGNKVPLNDEYVKTKMKNDYGLTWNDSTETWEGGNQRGDKMNALASRVDSILKNTRDFGRQTGLLSQDAFDALNNTFKYYVPLKESERHSGQSPIDKYSETDSEILTFLTGATARTTGTAGSGGSLSIKGAEGKRLKGGLNLAFSPLANVVAGRERMIGRGLKNKEFGEKLVNLIKENPNSEVWNVISPDNPRFTSVFESSYTYVGDDPSLQGKKTGDISDQPDKKNWVKQVVTRTGNPFMENDVMGVKIDGVPHYVEVKDPSLRIALNNLDAHTTNTIVEYLNTATRFMSFVNTSLNPSFVMGNFPRDLQTAIFNIVGEQTMPGGKAKDAQKIVGKVVKNTVPSIGVFYKGFRNPDKLSPEDKRNFEEFMESGAKTDWFHSLPPEQAKANIDRMIDMAQGTFTGTARQGYDTVIDFVENSNAAVENGVRLASFIAARDAMIEKGIDRNEAVTRAASLAKNLTVNFNRKGNSGNLLNGLYLFFNASVQGTVNMVRGLNPMNPNSSRMKQGIMGGLISMGATSAMLADMLMDDDELEDIPDYVRDRNLVIPDAFLFQDTEKGYTTIPLPYGYNVFHVMGELAYQVTTGKVSPEKAGIRLANVMMGSFNPIGTSMSDTFSGGVLKTAVPTVAKPVVELALNENYFGSPIYSAESPFPGVIDPVQSNRKLGGTAEAWRTVTSALNALTTPEGREGEYEAGFINLSPDKLSYIMGYYLGGAGQFAERTFLKAPQKLATGEEFETREIPFIRRIRGEISNAPDTNQFYERIDEIDRKKAQAESQKMSPAERKKYRDSNRKYIQMIGIRKGVQKTLTSLYRERRRYKELREKFPERRLEYAEKEQLIQDKIDAAINRFNDLYDKRVGEDK
tara:strand:+ start:5481 stop:11213 length:5733 start_codon:yes stop_codon:yes gene_type:complete